MYRLDLPPGPFGTIYCDPPWKLRTGGVKRKLHYDTMELDELKLMNVRGICAPDAHLWMWTTNPHLPEALELIDAWGFTYKTMLTWNKGRMGLGWWLRSQTEHLIFAALSTKARVGPGSWTTYLEAPWRGHSVKPPEAAEMIEALSPEPRLEIFARGQRPGWTCLESDQEAND